MIIMILILPTPCVLVNKAHTIRVTNMITTTSTIEWTCATITPNCHASFEDIRMTIKSV